MAGFEQNQQDAFNLRNNAESLKQALAEAEALSASIGDAELAAEEKLAKLRLKNLAEQQDERIKKLDELIKREEAGIRELASLRLKLSEKQFKVRKQEIQKELQLTKDAIEELRKVASKKFEAPTNKQATAPKNNSSTQAKATNATNETSKELLGLVSSIDNTLGTLRDTVATFAQAKEKDLLTGAEGQTSQQHAADSAKVSQNQARAAQPTTSAQADVKEQLKTSSNSNNFENAEVIAKATKSNIPDQQNTQQFSDDGMGYRDKVSIGENSFESILAGFGEVSKQLAEQEKFSELKVLNTVTNDKGATSQTSLDLAGTLIENIKAAEKAKEELVEFEKDKVLNSLMVITAERQRLEGEHSKAAKAAMEEESKAKAKAKDLTSNREKYAQENYAKLRNDFAKRQNKLTEEHYNLEDEIAYTNAHRVEILTQKEYALKDKYIKEEHDARLGALLDAGSALSAGFGTLLKNLNVPEEGPDRDKQIKEDPNLSLLAQIIEETKKDAEAADAYAEAMKKYAAAVEDAAKNGTEAPPPPEPPKPQVSKITLDYGNELLKSIEETRKAEEEFKEFQLDQERITQLIRQKREQERIKELGKKEREQIEERARLEEDAVFNAAHRAELLAQKEEDTKQKYLQEYNQLQLDSWNHLTENMTQAEFEKLRAETAAIEDTIKHRNDIATANEKALATIRNKGTLKEKKELLKAQIKEQAAAKDWSSYGDKFQMKKITEDMSDEDKAAAQKHNEEAQKAREQATAATMAVNAAAGAIADFAQKLSTKTDEIAKVQGILDTRLQGSRDNEKLLFSYGKKLQEDAKWIAGASPYMSQEKLVENMKTLVDKGISFDIKQRAFLMTIQEKIANTFDVADGTLLRLIRIQQQDTTAGRLGMESALNSFLNSMYETSEYLESVASNVRSSLEEMQALMDGKDATELEYQVQKWMGSLYSVGMSDSTVQEIAKTFGQIASGDISGLTGSGTGNLLIMAANEAGMSIADILQDGLKADETNRLMQAMVNYLAEIAETSSDSKVVQQQLANVYGMKASDLRAATNLSTSLKDVAKEDKSYFGMMLQLNNMMNTLGLRTSMGEGISNMWSNIEYTMASSMAANPISYLLPKLSKMLKDTTGGIALPFVNVYGFGVDLNTTVADLMSVAAMAPAVLGSLGPVLVGLSDLVNPLAGTTMLMRAGINPLDGALRVLARGTPATLQNTGGTSTSESGYIGNSSGDDVKNATLQDAEDSKKKQMVEAKEDETADDTAMKADLAVVNIYNLLEEVAHGSQSLRVRVVNGQNGAGSYGGGGSYSGGASSNQNPIGDNAGNGTTSGGAGAGAAYGTDNGNWVLAF